MRLPAYACPHGYPALPFNFYQYIIRCLIPLWFSCLHSSGLLAVGATVNILDWKLVLCPGAFSRMFAAANCYSPMIRSPLTLASASYSHTRSRTVIKLITPVKFVSFRFNLNLFCSIEIKAKGLCSDTLVLLKGCPLKQASPQLRLVIFTLSAHGLGHSVTLGRAAELR